MKIKKIIIIKKKEKLKVNYTLRTKYVNMT